MSFTGEWYKVWLYFGFVFAWTKGARPRFDTSTDMGLVLVPADAEVDSVIFRLRATDQDADFPLVFEITATITPVVRIDNLPCTLYNKVCQANVILTKRLVPGRLHDFAVRVRDTKGDSNSMQATISVTNATTPRDKIFPHIPSLIMVPEDTKPGKELDYLLVRANSWSGKPVYIELWQPKELFTIRQRQTPTQTRGVIILTGELDFETQSMYTLTMYATDPYTEQGKDTRNIAGLSLVVVVQDVQDVPPIFTLAPPLTRINNTVQPGDVVLRVHAEDGDKGVPREIVYGLVSEGNPFTPFFNISETNGEITLARPLEDLTQITHVGAPVVLTVVAEEIRRSRDEPPAQATIVDVGFLLGEPGNSPPYFESDNYMATIDENPELGTVINFGEQYSTRVRDEDIGKAGVFALKLENNNNTFEINPTVAERTADFIITVRDNTLIDYEMYKVLSFKIVAQEVGPATNLSTSVPVVIFLRDVNDNPPVFEEESYEVTLSENVTAGSRVIQVHAIDKDTGTYGSIRYTSITGEGSEAFTMDPDTGLITVAMDSSLDREAAARLILCIEAQDENGNGNKGVAPLIVNLLDVNDNAPIFERHVYEFMLNSDLSNFTSSAFIKAIDADAEPPNNVVRYEIVHGNYENKFYLNETSGELILRSPITKIRRKKQSAYETFSKKAGKEFVKNTGVMSDNTLKISNHIEKNETLINDQMRILTKEVITETIKKRRKRANQDALYTLTARAYDLGVPHLSSVTKIQILSGIAMEARIMMFVVPGEQPDSARTAETLAAITGGRVTVLETRPYIQNQTGSAGIVPGGGKKSIIVARVEQTEPGSSLVDVEKIRETLAANGVGIINGTETITNTTYMDNTRPTVIGTPRQNNANDGQTTIINNTITTGQNEEVTVYKAENKLLFWLLIILGLLMLLAIAALIICCICPGCPFYMAPRKRRVHSSETIIRADGRPKRHLHRQPAVAAEVSWNGRKQAWSADPTRRNWQFNKRNIKNCSLPGDVAYIAGQPNDIQLNVKAQRMRDGPSYDHSRRGRMNKQDRMYMEDVEDQKARIYDNAELDSLHHHEIERGSDLQDQVYRQRCMEPDMNEESIVREQHFYREGNAEVLRLVTRGQAEDTINHPHYAPHHHRPATLIVDGKDIILQRFIEDQKSRHELSMQDIEAARSMESHQRPKEICQQQPPEIILIPDRLDLGHRQHIEEIGPTVQRLVIDHGDYSPQKMEKEGSQMRESLRAEKQESVSGVAMGTQKPPTVNKEHAQSDGAQYHFHDLELARQNALLTRLLLEKENRRAARGVGVDSTSYLETQSLPGQVAIATQTDRTAATQTERQVRSRSDNDESDEESRHRKKLRSRKKYSDGDWRRSRTLWMKSPIEEEGSPCFDKRLSVLRKKVREVKEGRKILEPDVLKEISDSLDGNGSSYKGEEDETMQSYRKEQTSISYKILNEKESGSSEETRKEKYQKTCEDVIDDPKINVTESTSLPEAKKLPEKQDREKMKEHKSSKKEGKSKMQQMRPSFKILEKEFTMLTKKLSKLGDKKFQESTCSDSTSQEKSDSCAKDAKKDLEKKPVKKVDKMDVQKQEVTPIAGKVEQKAKQKKESAIAKTKQKLKYHQSQVMSTGSSEYDDALDKPKKFVRQDKVKQKQSTSVHAKVKRDQREVKKTTESRNEEIERRKDAAVKETPKHESKLEKIGKTITRAPKLGVISRKQNVSEETSTSTDEKRDFRKSFEKKSATDSSEKDSNGIVRHDEEAFTRKVVQRFSDDFVEATEGKVEGPETESPVKSVEKELATALMQPLPNGLKKGQDSSEKVKKPEKQVKEMTGVIAAMEDTFREAKVLEQRKDSDEKSSKLGEHMTEMSNVVATTKGKLSEVEVSMQNKDTDEKFVISEEPMREMVDVDASMKGKWSEAEASIQSKSPDEKFIKSEEPMKEMVDVSAILKGKLNEAEGAIRSKSSDKNSMKPAEHMKEVVDVIATVEERLDKARALVQKKEAEKITPPETTFVPTEESWKYIGEKVEKMKNAKQTDEDEIKHKIGSEIKETAIKMTNDKLEPRMKKDKMQDDQMQIDVPFKGEVKEQKGEKKQMTDLPGHLERTTKERLDDYDKKIVSKAEPEKLQMEQTIKELPKDPKEEILSVGDRTKINPGGVTEKLAKDHEERDIPQEKLERTEPEHKMQQIFIQPKGKAEGICVIEEIKLDTKGKGHMMQKIEDVLKAEESMKEESNGKIDAMRKFEEPGEEYVKTEMLDSTKDSVKQDVIDQAVIDETRQTEKAEQTKMKHTDVASTEHVATEEKIDTTKILTDQQKEMNLDTIEASCKEEAPIEMQENIFLGGQKDDSREQEASTKVESRKTVESTFLKKDREISDVEDAAEDRKTIKKTTDDRKVVAEQSKDKRDEIKTTDHKFTEKASENVEEKVPIEYEIAAETTESDAIQETVSEDHKIGEKAIVDDKITDKGTKDYKIHKGITKDDGILGTETKDDKSDKDMAKDYITVKNETEGHKITKEESKNHEIKAEQSTSFTIAEITSKGGKVDEDTTNDFKSPEKLIEEHNTTEEPVKNLIIDDKAEKDSKDVKEITKYHKIVPETDDSNAKDKKEGTLVEIVDDTTIKEEAIFLDKEEILTEAAVDDHQKSNEQKVLPADKKGNMVDVTFDTQTEQKEGVSLDKQKPTFQEKQKPTEVDDRKEESVKVSTDSKMKVHYKPEKESVTPTEIDKTKDDKTKDEETADDKGQKEYQDEEEKITTEMQKISDRQIDKGETIKELSRIDNHKTSKEGIVTEIPQVSTLGTSGIETTPESIKTEEEPVKEEGDISKIQDQNKIQNIKEDIYPKVHNRKEDDLSKTLVAGKEDISSSPGDDTRKQTSKEAPSEPDPKNDGILSGMFQAVHSLVEKLVYSEESESTSLEKEISIGEHVPLDDKVIEKEVPPLASDKKSSEMQISSTIEASTVQASEDILESKEHREKEDTEKDQTIIPAVDKIGAKDEEKVEKDSQIFIEPSKEELQDSEKIEKLAEDRISELKPEKFVGDERIDKRFEELTKKEEREESFQTEEIDKSAKDQSLVKAIGDKTRGDTSKKLLETPIMSKKDTEKVVPTSTADDPNKRKSTNTPKSEEVLANERIELTRATEEFHEPTTKASSFQATELLETSRQTSGTTEKEKFGLDSNASKDPTDSTKISEPEKQLKSESEKTGVQEVEQFMAKQTSKGDQLESEEILPELNMESDVPTTASEDKLHKYDVKEEKAVDPLLLRDTAKEGPHEDHYSDVSPPIFTSMIDTVDDSEDSDSSSDISRKTTLTTVPYQTPRHRARQFLGSEATEGNQRIELANVENIEDEEGEMLTVGVIKDEDAEFSGETVEISLGQSSSITTPKTERDTKRELGEKDNVPIDEGKRMTAHTVENLEDGTQMELRSSSEAGAKQSLLKLKPETKEYNVRGKQPSVSRIAKSETFKGAEKKVTEPQRKRIPTQKKKRSTSEESSEEKVLSSYDIASHAAHRTSKRFSEDRSKQKDNDQAKQLRKTDEDSRRKHSLPKLKPDKHRKTFGGSERYQSPSGTGEIDTSKAQPKYMAWYKKNREEMEKKRAELMATDDEEQLPRWLRRSIKSQKLEKEEKKASQSDKSMDKTPRARRKVKPLVNVESEQLKAIVRQGRKLRKAEGGKNEDPPVQIFASAPPTIPQTPSVPKHHLMQHSEYKYEKIPAPFYLHPPPAPHPSPQLSPEHFEMLPTMEHRRSEEDFESGIPTSLQGGNRLRHQQLLEKKSVFDIAYSEAAPSQLRSDSTTPPS